MLHPLSDSDSTAIRKDRLIAVKKTVLDACPKCTPEKDGEQRPGLVLVFPGEDIMVLDYESEQDRDDDYEMLCE